MVLLNHPSSRARGHSLNTQKASHLPQIVMALTFLSVCQKAPPGPARPVCGTAAETPLKKTADSPAPPTTTCTPKNYFRRRPNAETAAWHFRAFLTGEKFAFPSHYCVSIVHHINCTQTTESRIPNKTGLTSSHEVTVEKTRHVT